MYTGPDTASTRRDAAYHALKHRLLVGDFPPGGRLGEERLAAALGVSRTPVREALSRLHSEGLVERLPDGGFGPTLVNLHRIRELYEIRFALERFAIRRSEGGQPAHDEDQLARLLEEWREVDSVDAEGGDFVLLDEDFHERLAGAAGNGALVEQLHAVNERIRVVRMQDFLSPERIELTVEQHVAIVEALLRDDPDTAEHRLIGHFDESLAVVEERAAHAIARMLDRGARP